MRSISLMLGSAEPGRRSSGPLKHLRLHQPSPAAITAIRRKRHGPAESGGQPMMTARQQGAAPQSQGGGFGAEGADDEFPRIVRSGLRR